MVPFSSVAARTEDQNTFEARRQRCKTFNIFGSHGKKTNGNTILNVLYTGLRGCERRTLIRKIGNFVFYRHGPWLFD